MGTGVGKGRSVVVLVAILTTVPFFSSIPTAAHFDPEIGPERIFFADDPDPDAAEDPILEEISIRELASSEASITELARAYDFYYESTNPTYTIGSNRVSFREFQRNQLDEFTTSESTSRWLPGWGGPADGKYIKDATVGLVDVENGVRLHAPGTDADGQFLIPNTGAAYTYADFRIDATALPENYCTPVDWDYKTETYTVDVTKYDENGTKITVRETRTRRVRVDGDQWCYRYRLLDPVVARSLQLGNQEVGHSDDTSAGVVVATYTGLTPSEGTDLIVTAEVTIVEQTIERHRDWGPETGWDIQREDQTYRPFSVQVTHSSPVHVTTNRELTVHQRVIEFSDTRSGIVLEFDGPTSIADHRLWSRAIFTDQQELVNIWGIYSLQGPHHGFTASNRNPVPEAHEFPALPHLQVTARTDSPTNRYSSNGAVGYFAQPEVLTFDRQQLGGDPHDPGPRINLSTSPIFTYDVIVLKNAPGPVTEVIDIHGDRIPLETSVTTYRESELSIRPVGDSFVRLRLVDRHSGKGLPGRIIHISGANRSVVRTDEEGLATVRSTRRYVTAEFRGDDWTGDRPRFYSPDRRTVRVRPPTDSLIAPLADLIGQWRLIGFWVVLAAFGWLWYESR